MKVDLKKVIVAEIKYGKFTQLPSIYAFKNLYWLSYNNLILCNWPFSYANPLGNKSETNLSTHNIK